MAWQVTLVNGGMSETHLSGVILSLELLPSAAGMLYILSDFSKLLKGFYEISKYNQRGQLAMASIKSISKCVWSATNPLRNLRLAATIIVILFT